MWVIALAQQKGGVGKSVCCINLACQAAASGAKTALIDMDSEQGTSLKWGKKRVELFPTPDVLAANGVNIGATLEKLRQDGFAWAFIDLPGRNIPIATAGLEQADLVLIPTRPRDMDVEPSFATVRSVQGLKKPYAYVLNACPTQPSSTRAAEVASDLRKRLGHKVSDIFIGDRIEIADAIKAGKGISEFKPSSAAAEQFKKLFKWLEKAVKEGSR